MQYRAPPRAPKRAAFCCLCGGFDAQSTLFGGDMTSAYAAVHIALQAEGVCTPPFASPRMPWRCNGGGRRQAAAAGGAGSVSVLPASTPGCLAFLSAYLSTCSAHCDLVPLYPQLLRLLRLTRKHHHYFCTLCYTACLRFSTHAKRCALPGYCVRRSVPAAPLTKTHLRDIAVRFAGLALPRRAAYHIRRWRGSFLPVNLARRTPGAAAYAGACLRQFDARRSMALRLYLRFSMLCRVAGSSGLR